jgi:hypothetical protein
MAADNAGTASRLYSHASGAAWLRSTLGLAMNMKALPLLAALLICSSGCAMQVSYEATRLWVESRCATNTIPKEDRLFVGRWIAPQYAGIISYHKGVTLREVIDQTPFKGTAVHIRIYRPDSQRSYTRIEVGPKDKPRFKLRRLDMIWFEGEGPQIDTRTQPARSSQQPPALLVSAVVGDPLISAS